MCATHLRLRNTGQRTKRHTAHIGKTYGITQEDYQELLQFQGGVCYICQRRPGKYRLCVDHDHRIAREVCGHPDQQGCRICIRGLICQKDNKHLGWIRDDPQAMERGKQYLLFPPAQQLWRITNV